MRNEPDPGRPRRPDMPGDCPRRACRRSAMSGTVPGHVGSTWFAALGRVGRGARRGSARGCAAALSARRADAVLPPGPSTRSSPAPVVHRLDPADQRGRRAGSAGRSSRTRASPSARTSRGGSRSPTAPRPALRSCTAGRTGERNVMRFAGPARRRRPGARGAARARAARRASGSASRRSSRCASATVSRLRLGIPALGEVPHPLLAAPADDRDLAARVQHLQHQAHLARAPPAVRLALASACDPRSRARAAGPRCSSSRRT